MKLFILLLAITLSQINSQTVVEGDATLQPIVPVVEQIIPVLAEEEILVPLEEGEGELEIEALEQGEWFDFDFEGLKAFIIARFLKNFVLADLPQSNFRRARDYATYIDADRLNYKIESELVDPNIGVIDATLYVYYDPEQQIRNLISAEYSLLTPVNVADVSTNPLLSTLVDFGAGEAYQKIRAEENLDPDYQVESVNNIYNDVLETPEGEVDLYRFDTNLINRTSNRRFHVIYYVTHNRLSNVNRLKDFWYEEPGAEEGMGEEVLAAEEGVFVVPPTEGVAPTEEVVAVTDGQ